MADGRLIIITGPSCVGKSPLLRALRRNFPELMSLIRDLVLYNSREPRPGESDGKDYHFRERAEIKAMRGYDRYLVIEARDDLQAVDVEELVRHLNTGDVFFEGNPYVADRLLASDELSKVPKRSLFIAPLTLGEVRELQGPHSPLLAPTLTELMRRKLLRRANALHGDLSEEQLADIETRAKCALRELSCAHQFDHVVPNHDGEGSENWEDFGLPLGDARLTMEAVAALIDGKRHPRAEKWPADLVNAESAV